MAQGNGPNQYHIALATMYSVILAGGVVSMALMIGVLKSNVRSVTTVAVLNLIAVHLLFLLTVPFRIYFYATNSWPLTRDFCKVVSGMIHAHMYITFIFYVIILVIRHLGFFRGGSGVDFHRKLHAALASAAVWTVALAVVLPVFAVNYGKEDGNETKPHGSNETCFNFGGELQKKAVATLNYVIIAVVLLVTFPLVGCQVWIFVLVLRKYKTNFSQHQEFWAQVKSLCFVLVMFVCFVPYHLFRIRYVHKQTDLQDANEVFLAVTAFSCLDMLTFIGRNPCGACYVGSCCR
ncbi:probable G-protein coupled receptor 141 [Anguilla anguilla]|uniref:probable G-protein coupled receptor 141 n=1 Tax=Anguilla anguilla TaxID=7936 RepID=UPI0015AA5434|nr:probable G-protein coupled receptor 141 [Anguilla anguilla]